MHLERRIEYFLILVFVASFFLTRLPRLGNDEINPDTTNWYFRSGQFVSALKSGQFSNTYQHYHPGVTLMWIMGVATETLKQISPTDKVLNHINFEDFHFFNKLFMIFIQLTLSLILIYFLSKLFGFVKSIFTVLLFSLEPFFVGNSRFLHLDVLLTFFVFLGLVLTFLSLKKFKLSTVFLSGLFLSLAFLTKSIGIGALLFGILFSIFYFLVKRDYLALFKYSLTLILVFIVVTFIMFPALWMHPIQVLSRVFSESERIGARRGHEQIIFGSVVDSAGFLFYPTVIILKLSLITLFGLFVFIFTKFKKIIFIHKTKVIDLLESPVFYFSMFYLGYFFLMSMFSKKIDRYMLVLYPYLTLLAVLGFFEVKKILYKLILFVPAILVTVYSFITLFPYYFTYTNPLFGSPAFANTIIGQKSFGIGIFELRDFILKNYGYYPKLGFIDIKPMEAIYPNSKVFDIRVDGTSNYDLLVLGINEIIPGKVLKGERKFKYDKSIFINGLEYWRIYVKEN
ncbi:hypothetical protein A3H26_03250 [candidate division WWE3 bacterium RIFCSPLOWO2_12_FULL_36_10]|uniref:Glycosyltransferase RgtA/B/C/D-like domain-containing protein n=1 Tax=candidate division WWE3 bacterium RIFCSPLOWO2_12_FULL_36_10 TaxID=1802630 RepID=A0A1F4VK32_UNCKA|nr:MAG: hypothetical protein A3H26_03250 [candidate division WWE3 bacterium RIFCSPLOWO2_12_FULL_36_10]